MMERIEALEKVVELLMEERDVQALGHAQDRKRKTLTLGQKRKAS